MSSSSLWSNLHRELDIRSGRHLRRRLRLFPEHIFDVASNDYLGLATHPEVVEGAVRAAREYGAGARASRLVSGSAGLHDELEQVLAAFKETESALVFPSGYHANLGTITALAEQGTLIACHKRNHASLIDACRLASEGGAIVRYFDSTEKLRQLVHRSDATRKLIVVDGVFSMDGDLINLPLVLEFAREFDAYVILDDAHGTGTLGAHGRGITEHFQLHDERIIQIGTLSKALGSQGGFVAGPKVLIDYLVNAARPFVYTTGLNPPAVGAALSGVTVLQREPERVEKLRSNTFALSERLAALELKVLPQLSPILPVILGEADVAVRWSEALLALGFWCPAIRAPTVAPGTARLRLTVCSEWSESDLDAIVHAFQTVQMSTL